MKSQDSLFGENFKYILALTALAWMTYTLPSVRAAFQEAGANDPAFNAAAVSAALSNVKFPSGYTCYPNQTPISDVSAHVDNNKATLQLTYDSSKREALLTATFKVTVDGGKNGVYMYPYANISFRDQKDNYAYANSVRSLPIVPLSKVSIVTDGYGQQIFYVAKNKKADFSAMATVDPKSLFAGTYYASLESLTGSAGISTTWYGIQVDPNRTNTKTIVGEISPYITSISPNPATVGQESTITGQRLTGGQIYLDGAPVASAVASTPDSTTLKFIVSSSTPAGWHWVTVSTSNGMSNYVGFEVQSPIVNGCYVFSTNMAQGSTGPDVAALQTWLIANGYDIPEISSGQVAKGNYDAQTAAAVSRFQSAIGMPETGFVGPLTRAALNSSCTGSGSSGGGGGGAVICPAGYICTLPTNGTVPTSQVANCPAGYICTAQP
jgi:hypothetical protein